MTDLLKVRRAAQSAEDKRLARELVLIAGAYVSWRSLKYQRLQEFMGGFVNDMAGGEPPAARSVGFATLWAWTKAATETRIGRHQRVQQRVERALNTQFRRGPVRVSTVGD